MSAFLGKTDMPDAFSDSLLMTQSGHCNATIICSITEHYAGAYRSHQTHRADPAFGHLAGSGSGAVTAGDYNYSSSLRVSAGPSVERRLAIRPAIV
jgi:hypothetical protein